MPKPLARENGSAMHCHQSIYKNGKNIFYDEKAIDGLSSVAKYYMAGILQYAPGMTVIANPTVNSYKRLEVGYEAPVNIAWSNENRSTLIRVPRPRGNGTRMELRSPDATCNPYLLFALMIEAGLKGIEEKMTVGLPVDENIFNMSKVELDEKGIEKLPQNLREALEALENDKFLKDVLGNHVYTKILEGKYREWHEYGQEVHEWEINNYFYKY